MAENSVAATHKKPTGKRAIQVLIFILIFGAVMFIPAGRLDWLMGWVFIGTYLTAAIVSSLFLARQDPGLLAERTEPGENAKGWDKVLVTLYSLVSLPAILIVSGLNVRFGWEPVIPFGLQLAGLAFCWLAGGLVFWAMHSNTFFSTYVRIQTDRGHTAMVGGPYRFVRHPGYVGMIAFALSIPLILGSVWAFIPGGFGTLVILVRTAIEDRTLRRELDGYAAYAQEVRFRLLPGVW